MSISDPVAIVGLAGRFPGSGADIERFWDNIAQANDCSTNVPAGRWILAPEQCYDQRVPNPDSVYSTRGYFLDRFEPDLTGLAISSALVAELDPLFHLVLDVGNRAWQSAKTDQVDRRKVGIVLGNICLPTEKSNELCRDVLDAQRGHPIRVSHDFTGTSALQTHPFNRYVAGLPAGLLAKALGFGGGTYTLDAACASSLYAFKLAADELIAGRADAMLAGGCNRADSQYTQMGFAQLRALSTSSRCSPFDTAADGLMVGEGAGVFVLKRLSDAVRHGDRIHAVLCGWGLSNDIGANLLSPAVEGQLRAMRAAYRRAGWQPKDVELIECHATGTPVGDAVEFESLAGLWDDVTARTKRCVVGSVKSTVGHLLTGAGAAAIMKVVKAFAAERLPPQANFDIPGPNLRYAERPFRVLRQAEHWDPPKAWDPRRAAVSGFGFGGVNAHLLFEQYVGQEFNSDRTSVPAGPVSESLAALKSRLTTARDRPSDPQLPPTPGPIAVVGMAAQVGPWKSLRDFQEYILGGGTSHEPTASRHVRGLAAEMFPPGYFIDELCIRLDRFRIPPNELAAMLPQQLLMLQTAADALDDAGGKTGEADPGTGVFIGLGLDLNTTNFHLRWANIDERNAAARSRSAKNLPPLTADRVMGALGSITASRIARLFHFGGPSFTVCSEETSAGRAIVLAVRALQAREIDRALVGGVDLPGDPRSMATAPSGRIPGEGAAAIVLKRLADAERDADRVYAIITGVGAASGGPADGLAPDAATYATSLMRACTDAMIDPATIAYIDTANETKIDDAPEVVALNALMSATNRPFPLTIGSVEGQVGHTGFASAAAGLIKTCLALYQQILPTGKQGAAIARCVSPSQPRYWLTNTDIPRRAATGSVGTDGSCIHIVVAEYLKSARDRERIQPLGARSEALFAIEGDTQANLIDGLTQLESWLPDNPRSIEGLARDWFRYKPLDPQRKLAIAFVVPSVIDLRKQIKYATDHIRNLSDSLLPGSITPDTDSAIQDRVFYTSIPHGSNGKLAFVFPGSGNHFAKMGLELGTQWPELLRQQQFENQLLRDQIAPDHFWGDAISLSATPRDILFSQVATGTLVADLLATFKIQPNAVIGLSLGESAGLFGMRVWTNRDEMYRRLRESPLFNTDLSPPYNAARQFFDLSVGTPIDWVTGVLAGSADDVISHLRPGLRAYLQIVVTPAECVVGGLRKDVEQLVMAIGMPFVPLHDVTIAHCEVGKPVEAAYRDLHRLPVSPIEGLTVYSGVWSRPYKLTEVNAADSITAGLVATIDFPAVIETAYRDGVRLFVEIGPGNSCTRMIDTILGNRPHRSRAAHTSRIDATTQILQLIAQLLTERVPLSLERLYGVETTCAGHRILIAALNRELIVPVGFLPIDETAPDPFIDSSPTRGDKTLVDNSTSVSRSAVAAKLVAVQESDTFTTSMAYPLVIQDNGPFVAAAVVTQQAAADAHTQFLRVQDGLTRTVLATLQLQTQLLKRVMNADPEGVSSRLSKHARATTVSPRQDPPRILSREQCIAFARGKAGDVLGPLYAEADTFPTRVRLPDGPLMLVDRILKIEGEPKSMTSGRVVTEHTVRADRWYLEAGHCPTSITVESGQADLFLSGFLGIDFHTRGEAVYRLLDAVVTFHRGLPQIGERIEYDIRIDEFVRQAGAWLFRFRFEGKIDGQPLLSMQHGVAGFFTQSALSAGQGIVHTKLDLQPLPGKKPADWQDLIPPASSSLTHDQVEALRRGDLPAAFGPTFAHAKLRSPLPLPGGKLRLLDRVTVLDTAGGRFGLGFARAEYDIRPQEWFIECHFVDDKVMPGTLMYECCLHTMRVLLMRMGWVGEAGVVVYEPVPGVHSRLKCRGQVLETTGTVTYEVSIKELGYRPEPFAIADALMYADGKPIVEMTNMSLRLTGLTRNKLEAIWANLENEQHGNAKSIADFPGSSKPAVFDHDRILAFSNGNPSAAFGEPYRVFDRDRVIARLPGPPFQFLDRITAVTGAPYVLKAGATCEAQYDVDPNAWYFAANRCPRMPFSVLLEIALQPCGWLAAYAGSALASATDLCFRNLGGKGTQFEPIGLDAGTLTTTVSMTNVAISGGMIIQHYEFYVCRSGRKLYEGDTYFGFFSKDSLRNQVGMPAAKVPALTDYQLAFADAGELPRDPPFPDSMLRMIDRIDGYLPRGGANGLGQVHGRIAVNPAAWFFAAHFYQDPVWPGSLGLESLLQLLKYVAWKKWGDPGAGGWQTVGLNRTHTWTYRGQVVPTDREVSAVLEVTEVDPTNRRMSADGFLLVDGRVIYQITGFTLE